MKTIILATSNAGKIKELQALLAPCVCISQASLGIPAPEETGLSFIENALLKARHAAKISGHAALADDSGLVVRALDGQPGIYSARFAGIDVPSAEHIKLLLHKLKGIPLADRDAFFYCAIAYVRTYNDPTPLIATGRCDGIITTEPHGTGGFGYDPVFYLPPYQCTMADVSTTIKNTISHRALALKNLQTQREHDAF